MTRFSPACRGKGDHGNVACTCDSLFPLPGEEKAIMGAWQGCLGASYGLSPLPVKQKAISRLPWKALGIFGGSARDGLFPMPIEGNAISGLHQKRPGCLPKMPGELEAENYIDG